MNIVSVFIWMILDNRRILFIFGITLLIVVLTDWILGMTKAPGNGLLFSINVICRIACLYFAFIIIPVYLFSFSLSMKRAEKDFGNAMYYSLDEKTDGGLSEFKKRYKHILELIYEKD